MTLGWSQLLRLSSIWDDLTADPATFLSDRNQNFAGKWIKGRSGTDPDQDPANCQKSGETRKAISVDVYDLEAVEHNNPSVFRCSVSFE